MTRERALALVKKWAAERDEMTTPFSEAVLLLLLEQQRRIDALEGIGTRRGCPTCGSKSPELHPAVQHEGEVQICNDEFHWSTPAGRRALARAARKDAERATAESETGS
jgi:hypothetical protein